MLVRLSAALVVSTLVLPHALPPHAPITDGVLPHLAVAAVASPALVWLALRDQAAHAHPSNFVASFVAGAAVWHALLVCFGAPLVQLAHLTLLFACVLSAFTAVPFAMVFGFNRAVFEKLFFVDAPESDSEKRVHLSAVAMAAGAWVGSLPMLLDWDRPWQQWPIPCFYGAVVGYLVGALIFATTRGRPIYGNGKISKP